MNEAAGHIAALGAAGFGLGIAFVVLILVTKIRGR